MLVAAGEAVSAAAGGMGVLLTGQAIAGVGAAAIFPSSPAMVAADAPDPRRRAGAIAAWAASLAAGGFVAPVIGGLVGTHVSWRWALIAVALLGGICTLVNLTARDSSSPKGRSLDPVGQATVAIGLVALLYAVVQGPSDGWGSTRVVTSFVVAAVFLVLFVVVELRVKAPLLHLDLFANRSFSVVSIATVLGMFSFLGTVYALSILLGPVQHLNPEHVALAFLLTNGPTAVLAPVTARLLHRTAPRWLLGAGFVLIAVGDLLRPDLGHRQLAAAQSHPAGPDRDRLHAGRLLGHRHGGQHGQAAADRHGQRDDQPAAGHRLHARPGRDRRGRAQPGASHFSSSLTASPLPPQVKGAAGQVAAQGGPLAVNSLPPQSPPGAAAPLALDALGSGYSLGFVVCAFAAVAAALLSLLALRGTVSPHATSKAAAQRQPDAEVALG